MYTDMLNITNKPSSAVMDPQNSSRLSSTGRRPPLVDFDAHLPHAVDSKSDCLAQNCLGFNCRADPRRIRFHPKKGIRHWALGWDWDWAMTVWKSAEIKPLCPVRRLDEVRRGDRTHKGASPDEWAREAHGAP